MPKFSPRRVLQKELQIFKFSGKSMLLWIRSSNPENTGIPTRLIDSNVDADESTLTKMYIFGKFEEVDAQSQGEMGRERFVKGVITIPMFYRKQLALTEYIDPYLDGSRFQKVGAIVNESRGFITQNIQSMSLADPSEVS